jgi:hypothetical protein
MNDPKYSPPTLTVIGSLATDTQKEIYDTINSFGSGKS